MNDSVQALSVRISLSGQALGDTSFAEKGSEDLATVLDKDVNVLIFVFAITNLKLSTV